MFWANPSVPPGVNPAVLPAENPGVPPSVSPGMLLAEKPGAMLGPKLSLIAKLLGGMLLRLVKLFTGPGLPMVAPPPANPLVAKLVVPGVDANPFVPLAGEVATIVGLPAFAPVPVGQLAWAPPPTPAPTPLLVLPKAGQELPKDAEPAQSPSSTPPACPHASEEDKRSTPIVTGATRICLPFLLFRKWPAPREVAPVPIPLSRPDAA